MIYYVKGSLNRHEYRSILPTEYIRGLCLIPSEVLGFIVDSHPKEYEKLTVQYGEDTEVKLCKRLNEEISRRGVIDVQKNGFKDRGCSFSMVYFEPNSGLNLEHRELYLKNRHSLILQLKYSLKNENSIDMALFLNGIPLLTMELKNQLPGQDFRNSEVRYRHDRDSK